MSDWFTSLSPHWFWLSVGIVLCAAEIVAPGFFLMWLGAAAILTGVVAWLFPVSIAIQTGLFAVMAIVGVYAARKWLMDNPIVSDDPLLNNRGGRLVGEVVTVTTAIADGRGRVKVGDSEWNARGPDAVVGTKVRVTASNGSELQVELA
jgi:membrane protein implicated in regulation of membrane protease activity